MPEIGPAQLLARRVEDDPARPLVTFYDDAGNARPDHPGPPGGERIELSARTFANWVAKTANLLVDGLGAQPGDRVVLALPPHWQTAVWLMACWSAGVLADTTEPDAAPGPYILVASADVLAHGYPADAEEVVGLSLDALGRPLGDHPPEILDYAVEIRGYGDRFMPYAPVNVETPALRVADESQVTFTTLSHGELAARAVGAARDMGLDARSRVLTTLPFGTLRGVLVGLLAPLAAAGSVIIQRNLDEKVLDRRISLEHVTAVAGVQHPLTVHP